MANTIKWNTRYVRECMSESAIKYGDDVYCVYCWKDRFGNVFYVGSGKGYRFNQADAKCRSSEFMEWYNRGGCYPEILAYGMDKETSKELERKLIKEYWGVGFPLVNKEGIPERENQYRAQAEQTKIKRGIKPYMHRKTAN